MPDDRPYLLDYRSEQMLESWIGGDSRLQFTRIYRKRPGDDAEDFHRAVDGRGATIVVMIAVDDGVAKLVGGYNPVNWHSTGTFANSFSAERRSFLFNLSDGTKFEQRLDIPAGGYEIFGSVGVGPSFGMGFDLHVDGSLSAGYSNLFTYASNEKLARSIVSSQPFDGKNMAVTELEVYTVTPLKKEPERCESAEARETPITPKVYTYPGAWCGPEMRRRQDMARDVVEPDSLALFGGALACLIVVGYRRSRRH